MCEESSQGAPRDGDYYLLHLIDFLQELETTVDILIERSISTEGE
jgi:hypothetical protein